MGLGVEAGGTEFGGILGLVEVAAVDAAPDDDAVALEDLAFGEVLPEVEVAFFMLFFSHADLVPERGDFLKAFLAGDAGEFGVKFGPFLVFAPAAWRLSRVEPMTPAG